MNEKIKKIKDHLKRNHLTYISSSIIVAGFTLYIMRESHAALDAGAGCPKKEPMYSFSFNFGKSIFGSVTNSAVTTIHKGTKGHPGFVTRCVETGDLFETQGVAARTFDIPETIMSKHLNQGRELIENLHFERVGVLTAA